MYSELIILKGWMYVFHPLYL